MGMIFTILVLILISFLSFLFYKNNFDINKTIRYIRVNYFKCCIKDEKKIEEKIGVKAVQKLKGELTDINDCKEPLPEIPLDLCLSSELEVEELKIREKIFRQLKERENFVVDGGKNKMILPLEATIFLTKNFNPLVSEEGNILVIAEHKEISGSTEFEEIRLYLKDNDIKNERGELIYKDDKSILNLIKSNINAEIEKSTDRRAVKRFNPGEVIEKEILENKKEDEENNLFEEIDEESSTNKKEDDFFEEIDKELSFGKTEKKDSDIFADIDKELSFEKTEKKDSDIFADIDKELSSGKTEKKDKDIFADIDKELSSEKTEKKDKDIFVDIDKELSSNNKIEEEQSFMIDDNPFGDEEIDFSKLDEEISSELEFEEDNEEDKNERDDFFKRIKYKRLSIKNITKENIEEDIKEVFKNIDIKEAILNNLIKTKPLIFNANKEVIFIDMKNFLFALSKVYGIEASKKIELFDKLDIPLLRKVSNIIADGFIDEISDLISGNKKVNRVILERNGEYYFSFGLYIMSDMFKKVLSDEDFDFFRQYPYNTEYNISDNSNKTNTPLTPSIKDCEI